MLVGIDLDHTIIDYRQAFNKLALEWNLIPSDFKGSKTELREFLKTQENGHTEWMRLQGYIYGKGIHHAQLMPGFIEFVRLCRDKQVKMIIISHKTQYGHFDEDKVDLRLAALNWLKEKEILNAAFGFETSDVFFESTKEEKIARIKTMGCTHFIDDLLDIFTHNDFPQNIPKYLLTQDNTLSIKEDISICTHWVEITKKFFSHENFPR